MTEHFRSKPENATLDAHAFAPLDDIWEYTAIPVLDMSEHLDDGTPICGQFTYADGMAALKRLGLEPLTTYDVETLHDLATRGQCIELPAFTSTATAETSLAWRKVSDKANRDNMLRLGWKPGMRVCNFGKGWIAGAPAGRGRCRARKGGTAPMTKRTTGPTYGASADAQTRPPTPPAAP